jgi:hypothetical protein
MRVFCEESTATYPVEPEDLGAGAAAGSSLARLAGAFGA